MNLQYHNIDLLKISHDQLAHLNVKIVYNTNSTVYSAEG